MRVTTPRKQAMRTLWHAGRYLQAQLRSEMNPQVWVPIYTAMMILTTRYNEVLGEPDGQSIQRTA